MASALLLGPGYPVGQLDLRQEIKRLVEKDGPHEGIIMELVCSNSKLPLHTAFEKLLEKKHPNFIIAIYTENGMHNAVDFELGTLTCHFEKIKEKLLILTDHKLDDKRITRYLTEGLYYRVTNFKYRTLEDAAHKIIVFMNAH